MVGGSNGSGLRGVGKGKKMVGEERLAEMVTS